MARNKYPEETKQLILDVAQKLFMEKGYDDTTIQDIIDGLGGLTKGVIYHHFKSKEDIFEQVLEYMAKSDKATKEQIDQESTNGLEKIQMSLIAAIKRFEMVSIFYRTTIMQKSERMIGQQYNECFTIVIPNTKKMIQEGIEDGSIVTEFPDEAAEIMTVLSNLWIAIQMPNWNREEFKRKFVVLKKILESLNVFIITDKTFEALDELYDYLEQIEKKAIAD